MLELAYGYRRRFNEGDTRFAAALDWVRSTLPDRPPGELLTFGTSAAAVAGEIRALQPFPPSTTKARRSKAESRVAWLLDVEIASTAWVAGFDIASDNATDFEAVADALELIAPGAPPLRVVPAEA